MKIQRFHVLVNYVLVFFQHKFKSDIETKWWEDSMYFGLTNSILQNSCFLNLFYIHNLLKLWCSFGCPKHSIFSLRKQVPKEWQNFQELQWSIYCCNIAWTWILNILWSGREINIAMICSIILMKSFQIKEYSGLSCNHL